MDGLQEALTIAQALLRRRAGGPPYPREVFEEVARAAIDTLALDDVAHLVDRVINDLQARHSVSIGVETVLEGDELHAPWYVGERATPGPFADRYFRFLAEREGWPESSVASLITTTARITGLLGDPARAGEWDRRGLVVGHVQSGKTANYAGVICRAADAGYKLIVVMGGMHNALRAQTQMRLDRDFLGYESSRGAAGGRRPIGVSDIDARPQAQFLTSRESSGDFNANRATAGIGVHDVPVLLVVKKNASILANLNGWVDDFLKARGLTQSAPLLVIDDEADQASVDTKDQINDAGRIDPDHDPTRINREIRRLLNSFRRSSYVAYTATPFANILIHDETDNTRFGEDLFPRSFIVNLPTPSNYVGPSLIFDGDREPPDLVRPVPQSKEDWIPEKHDSAYVPTIAGVQRIPESLENAVLSFLLACAARRARGQTGRHNSMLIHVSRFKQVQERVHAQVQAFLEETRSSLRFGIGGPALRVRMEQLWRDDFARVSRGMVAPGQDIVQTRWEDVADALLDAIDPIEVRLVNSDIKEPLDYDRYAETGLNVIAVGGDKLSRGLTLEGLSVSYFLRASRMYDSLMQMGRWFGYRPGYLDLCRIYMPAELREWFEHVARAAEDLREQLDHMAAVGATPKDYGLRVRAHDVMLVTATNKQRYGEEFELSYAGRIRIPTLFSTREPDIRRNVRLVRDTLISLGEPGVAKRGSTDGMTWNSVDAFAIRDLISAFGFHPDAIDVRGRVMADYINAQLAIGELTEWTVSLRVGDGTEVEIEGLGRFKTIERKKENGDDDLRADLYKVRTVLSPHDEAIDLDDSEYAAALAETVSIRRANNMAEPALPGGVQIRAYRSPRRGLLLLYPLDPRSAGLTDTSLPIFAPVLSFPGSRNAKSVRVLANTVYMRQEFVG
jgi:hypothetical protein